MFLISAFRSLFHHHHHDWVGKSRLYNIPINRIKIIKKNNNNKLTNVVLKVFKGRNMRHIGEELITVSSSSLEKGKLEHIFLTVRFKKLKSMAALST